MTRVLYSFLLMCLMLPTSSQENETLNFTDERGLKQGKWIKFYENKNPQYEGYFSDNEPVGEFIRYLEEGGLSSILLYDSESDTVKAEFFHPNGYIAAIGIYISREREGFWSFYSAKIEDYLVCRELYRNNLKEGESIKYHWNTNRAEELLYQNDQKDGPWKQYYTDGILCIKSTYVKGKLNGDFETFLAGGEKEITGRYINDVRDGTWTFFNIDGTVKKIIIYHNGIPENRAELIKEETEYLDMLEKNGGKIEDPGKMGKI